MHQEYEGILKRVFEDKDQSTGIVYFRIAEILISSPEPSTAGEIYYFTMRFPISREKYETLQKKIEESQGQLKVKINLEDKL